MPRPAVYKIYDSRYRVSFYSHKPFVNGELQLFSYAISVCHSNELSRVNVSCTAGLERANSLFFQRVMSIVGIMIIF
jgi:hypothetical protein